MLCAAVPGRKWFKEFAGVGHASTVNHFRREWNAAVRQFLQDAHVVIAEPETH